MRRFSSAIAGIAGIAALVAACSGSSPRDLPKPSPAFCAAAKRYEDRIQTTPRPSVAEQITLVERIAQHAPADVRADARRFLDAMRRVRTDSSVKDDPSVHRAVDNVNRRAGNGCGLYQSDTGGGI